MKKITAIIPCYNEEAGIAAVIRSFPRTKLAQFGYELDVLVVDNNSSDRTSEVAAAAGARVIFEPKQGKGNAIRSGFYNIADDTDFVVMLDGDDTYKASEIMRLIEPLDSNFCDVIIGSRLGGKIKDGSMKLFNRLGNWVFSFLVRTTYKVNVTDVLTGYFAWRREAILELRSHLRSSGFAIEMEMITKMARLGNQIYSVPISYEPRLGESSLRPVHDGLRIFRMYLRSIRWQPTPRRIAFVSDAVLPFHKGGKEKRLQEISRRLVTEGREVHIYTMKWWEGPDYFEMDGVHMHAICKRHPLYTHDKRSIRQAVFFGIACLKLWREKFDIVDVDHMPFFPLFAMWLICGIRRKKLYGTWHEVWGRTYWKNYLGLGGLVGSTMEWLSFRLPDVIISNSEHTTRNLLAANVKKPIITIPLGVDLDDVMASEPNARKSDIIFAGRLLAHKNIDVLIRSVAEVKKTFKNVSCIIIGDGPERAYLEELVRNLRLTKNVTFYNFIEEHRDVLGLMKASRLLVQPSVREGFGLIVVEANACGLPVITTDHPQNAAKDLIVEGRNGLLTSLDPAEMAENILTVLADETMGSYVRSDPSIQKYHWQTVAEEMEKAFAV